MCTEIENNQGRKKGSDNGLFAGILKMMFELERLLDSSDLFYNCPCLKILQFPSLFKL